MDLQKIYQKTNNEKRDIAYNWFSVYMPKINNWIKKADDSDDFFDKYIFLFIAVNITYNIWAKAKNPKTNLTNGDRKRFEKMGENLLEASDYLNLIEGIEKLKKILKENDLVIFTKEEEENGIQKVFNGNSPIDKKFEKFWLSFYLFRCNLVHGEKGYEDRQVKLLKFACESLKNYLEIILVKLEVIKKILVIQFKLFKGKEIESIQGKKYKIVLIDKDEIVFKRLHAKDCDREYEISFNEIFSILKKFYGREDKINTSNIKEYVNGRQSPMIAIIEHCK